MHRESYPLNPVSFDAEDFGSQAVDALLTNKAFRVVELPEGFVTAIQTLIGCGHNFFDGVNEEVAKKYTTEVESFMGLVRSNKFPSICNALRFFTKLNTDGKVENKVMPDDEDAKQMREAAETVNKYLREMLAAITCAIEKTFSYKEDALTSSLGHGVINATRYTPVTQEVVEAMFNNKSLVLSEDGEAMLQFLPHGDLSMFTVLMYSHSTGLEIRSDLGYAPVDVKYDQHGIIVLTGTEMEKLTAGKLTPAVHRVIATPQMAHQEAGRTSHDWRFSLSCHMFYNVAEKQGIGALDGSQEPTAWKDFFLEYQQSMYEDDEERVAELPQEFLVKFPESVEDKAHYKQQFEFGYEHKSGLEC